jgi:hypothetical protein
MTDQDAIDWLKSIAELEQDPACHKATITMGPWSAFIAIAAWQLAMRHPDFSMAHAELVGNLIEQLSALFDGTPGAELLGLGSDPARDVPIVCRHPIGPHAPECPPGDHLGDGAF